MMENDPPDVPDAFESPDPGWRFRLARPKDGDVFVTLHNAMMILANDDPFTGALGPMFGQDVYSGQPVLLRAPPRFDGSERDEDGPYPRGWLPSDVSLICGYLQCVWNKAWHRSTVSEAMEVVARQNPFHPILDWLDSLVWDGVKRIDRWVMAVYDPVNEFRWDSDDEREVARWKSRNAYHSAVGVRMLVASVRRLRQPGVKFDTMAILEGAQRIGKSTSISTLYGTTYYTDTVFHDLKNKEAAQGLHGKWVIEFSEIDHIIRADVETLKAFLSKGTDYYRPPYERSFRDVPRSGVFWGTSNADDYLRDTSGNTRIWPIHCRKADVAWLALNREQLWAEAVVRERQGDAVVLWLDTGPLQDEAALLTGRRLREDVWQPIIESWLEKTEVERQAAVTALAKAKAEDRLYEGQDTDTWRVREPIYTARVLEYAIGMTKDKMNKQAEMRVADIFRRLGWVSFRRERLPQIKDKPLRGTTTVWRKPDVAPDETIDENETTTSSPTPNVVS